MKANVGSLDKLIRIIAGIAILSLFFVLEGNSRYFALIGLVPLITGFINWCPLYRLLGVSTCSISRSN